MPSGRKRNREDFNNDDETSSRRQGNRPAKYSRYHYSDKRRSDATKDGRGTRYKRSGNQNSRGRKYRKQSQYSGRSSSGKQRSKSFATTSSSIDDEVGHFDGRKGDTLLDRYVIERELGKGTFGKVYHCYDRKHRDEVAVKIIRSIPRYIDSALIEADLLQDIYTAQKNAQTELCVKMYSKFHMRDHYCMVFESLGCSLYDIIKRNDYKRLPMQMVQDISRQLLETMRFLKSINLIHTDLKLENVLFAHTTLCDYQVRQNGETYTIVAPVQSRIKVIDFGGATYDDDRHKSTIINTRQYRGPEVTLALPWSFPSDLWSVGCIIGEIYRGDLFFQTHDELEHLALMEKLCGRFPRDMVDQCEWRHKYFHRNGDVRVEDLSQDSRKFVRGAKSFREFFSLEESDRRTGICELVEGLLRLDPHQRVTAREALKYYPFVQSPATEESHSSHSNSDTQHSSHSTDNTHTHNTHNHNQGSNDSSFHQNRYSSYKS